jgi:cytochrome c-type biogenesis protein CcmF
MTLGILGVENLSTATDIHLGDGESITLENRIFRGHFLEDNDSSDGVISYKFGVYVSTTDTLQHELIPHINYYSKLETYQTIPATATGILQDVQVILHKPVENKDEDALLRMNFFPLINWLWIGGGLMVVGGFVSLLREYPAKMKN